MDEKAWDLAEKHIFLGTSSWKYEGWKNWFYKASYRSEKDFQKNCLQEYASYYPVVGIDHTYYQWPLPSTFEHYDAICPQGFKWILKATDQITIYKYPHLPRFGPRKGKLNESFLDFDLFKDAFLTPLSPFKPRIACIMLEFSAFHHDHNLRGRDWLKQLDEFLSRYRQSHLDFPLAVEIRNANWLNSSYLEVLQKHEVGHVLNSWSAMPALGDQLDKILPFSWPFFIARILLKPGRSYQNAVDTFAPYQDIAEVLPETRASAAKIIDEAIKRSLPAYILVNNRAEGCAPKTNDGIIEQWTGPRGKF